MARSSPTLCAGSSWAVLRLCCGIVVAAVPLSCAPDLPGLSRPAGVSTPEGDGGILLEIDPPAPADAAPPILRLRLSFDGASETDLSRIFLVEGEVGPAHLRQIEKDTISKALSKRMVPTIAWVGDDGGSIVIAPSLALALGETYAIASGDPPFAIPLHVAKDDGATRMDRIWPPVDGGATTDFGVWCGTGPLDQIAIEAKLEPSGPIGMIRTGVVDGAGSRCVRFEAAPHSSASSGEPLIGPPAVELPDGVLRLDPRLFVLDPVPPSVEPAVCVAPEIRFGPACARVLDDRLIGRSPEEPLLWAVKDGSGLDEVFVTAAGDPFVLSPLSPSTSLVLDVSTVDVRGSIARAEIAAVTLAPMPHVILNEVMANPLGAEPAQEWVELINDGSVEADLSGYILADIGGETVLPEAILPPGAFALITNESFLEDDELDPVPPPDVLILRVPKLGKDGLSNAGEPLKLLDAVGNVVSRFPATPKPKAGWSITRVSPAAPDGLPSSFKGAEPSPGTENGP